MITAHQGTLTKALAAEHTELHSICSYDQKLLTPITTFSYSVSLRPLSRKRRAFHDSGAKFGTLS
uniref:Uncharacterized protein n=1 Tax=Romanomermis culicivorax TaxID=13658 RepID=A0A915HWH1_ROMCU